MKILILFAFTILVSCFDGNNRSELNVRKGSIEINEKKYNEDSSKLLVKYCYNEGAFGRSANSWAVVDSNYNQKDLEEFVIPFFYENLNWKSQNVIEYSYNWIGNNLRTIQNTQFSNKINGVHFERIDFNKLAESDKRIIDFEKHSFNGDYKLVIYHYEMRQNMWDSIIHISILSRNESVPLYGNLYIDTKNIFGQIVDVKWFRKNHVKIILKDYKSFKLVSYSKIEQPLNNFSSSKKVKVIFEYLNSESEIYYSP